MLNLSVETSELIKILFAFETTYSKFASEGDPDLARHARGGYSKHRPERVSRLHGQSSTGKVLHRAG